MDAPFSNVVSTVDELRTIYREPHQLVTGKKVPKLTEPIQRFIASSPFCLLATSDTDGRCDVSPRGGPPGFVRTLDDKRIVIPDLTGNNLIDSLTNIVAIGIEVGTAYMHCAKSFRRGRVWDVASWDELDAPDACELLPGATTPEITKLIRDALDEGYVAALAEEKA